MMRVQKSAFLTLVAILFCVPAFVQAEDRTHHAEHGIQLSPDLEKLLNEEMEAIQNGMMALVPAISSGEWGEVAEIGKRIKASFILKKKITQAQREELHRVLPPVFIEMDQAFHNSAGMLAHAAEMKNSDVVNFYFYKLTEACVSCHAKFATSRFPGFAEETEQKEHDH
jgi:hypothetical protein